MPPVLAAIVLLLSASAVAAAAPWVSIGPDGKLEYATDERGNRIPDFSNCGYRGGGVALPTDVPVRVKVSPQASGDDGARIQAAIDDVSKLPRDARGIRGAVLLEKGKYRIAGSLLIKRGGVVLRGQGQGDDGTILVATGKDKRALIHVGGAGGATGDDDDGPPAKADPSAKKTAFRIADAYVPVGATSVTLEQTGSLKVGDEVAVIRPSTAEWIAALGMDRIPPRKDGQKVVQWTAGSKTLTFDRIITAIDGTRVSFDAPLVNAFDTKFGGGEVLLWSGPPRVKEIGVENLRGVSEHAGKTDEDHSWCLISVSGVSNGWVRDVTSLHFAGNLGSGHGWAGANQVCWNCTAKQMLVESPPTAQNRAIGCSVKARKGNGIWESVDHAVEPKSLYLAQLKDRLGAAAVAAIGPPASGAGIR